MFATTKNIYKRNERIFVVNIVVDLFVVRSTTRKTWKCLVGGLPSWRFAVRATALSERSKQNID